MARIAVTGAAGFIGANLVSRLVSEGHEVTATDIKTTEIRRPLYERADEVLIGPDYDLRKTGVNFDNFDRLYHLAADHGGAGYFHSDADFKAARNNTRIDANVLEAAMKAGIGRLFFASSACTYPISIQGEGARSLKESDWGNAPAEALYGEAKRMTTLFMEGARQHGFDARCGLFHTIYGPGQDYLEPRAKFPTAIVRKIVENPHEVEVWGDGSQVRTFLYIDDALDKIIALTEAENYEGPVNIGSDEIVTVQQCCEWAADAAGARPKWIYTDGPVGVAARSADNTEWNRRFGETPLIPAREGFGLLHHWLAKELG